MMSLDGKERLRQRVKPRPGIWSVIGLLNLCAILAACTSTSAVADPREEAWAEIRQWSWAAYTGNDEMRLTSYTPLLINAEATEYILLTRAAGEALKKGYAGFAIKHVEYEQDLDALRPRMPALMLEPIGNYGDLLAFRRDNTASVGRVRQTTYVIELYDDAALARHGGFDATETYLAMSEILIARYL